MPKGSNSSYSINVENLEAAFYRLKINDIDGTAKYSEIIKVKSGCVKAYSIIPNPARTYIEITGTKGNEIFTIFDIAGKKVSSGIMNVSQPTVALRGLTPGVYIFQIIDGGAIKSNLKFVKN